MKMSGDRWALQHILAAQHWIARWTDIPPREIGKETCKGRILMARTWDANLDPKVAELVNAAFDKSWQFVKTDPELAHADLQEMRTRLGQNLARLAQNGERDLWRLANAAIGQLRRERSAA
jgi:hypothetical protein